MATPGTEARAAPEPGTAEIGRTDAPPLGATETGRAEPAAEPVEEEPETGTAETGLAEPTAGADETGFAASVVEAGETGVGVAVP
nr:hypothetical protein Ade03nite_27220 [Actinoplanes derwentensis]